MGGGARVGKRRLQSRPLPTHTHASRQGDRAPALWDHATAGSSGAHNRGRRRGPRVYTVAPRERQTGADGAGATQQPCRRPSCGKVDQPQVTGARRKPGVWE